ncbi:hypothetical protein ATANTOWER_016859, partial [Ataeniobius toweri]|nr:hypothetical protein [Ataeniobius toweri]
PFKPVHHMDKMMNSTATSATPGKMLKLNTLCINENASPWRPAVCLGSLQF